ncbi:hypothetical protein ZWY2020_032385 [Hordeum vulgare]|nr:hypothetical protein ZWY2020_032385 [Hordeum vulgare]
MHGNAAVRTSKRGRGVCTEPSTRKPFRAMQKRSAKKGGKGSGGPKKDMGCSSGSVPKKARTTRKSPTKCGAEHEEEEEEMEIVNVFSHEMDSLECDICFLPFESRVYSCKNGHAACAACCINMERECPSCREPIGDFRCRATEKILAGMTRPCRFKKHGCTETVRYTEARAHEEDACRFAPYRCPFDGCAYRGLMLYDHIQDDHAAGGGVTSAMGLLRRMTVTLQKAAPFLALMHRDGESVFLLLNRGGDDLTGRRLSVICICPYPLEEDEEIETEYTMVVKGDVPASLSLTATVPFVRRLQGYKANAFIIVPKEFWDSSGSVTVNLQLS